MSGTQPDLNTQVTITLPLGAWNTVLSIIGKSAGFSWEMTNPLIQVIQQQIMQAQQVQRPLPRAVGDDE